MHICTFGNRAYAHQLASILDPKRKYFCQRILSRDECFNPVTKSANLRYVFSIKLPLLVSNSVSLEFFSFQGAISQRCSPSLHNR